MSVDSEKCFLDLSTGIRMAYVEVGPADGTPIVLLHGLTDTARSWSSTMAALHVSNPKLRIIAVDQRGHGASSMPTGVHCPKEPAGCFTPALFAAELADFFQKKGIKKATVAGHSMGSLIAQEFALTHSDLVSRIVLIATTARSKDNAILRDYVLKEPVQGSWKQSLDSKGMTSPEAVWNATPKDADPNAESWILKNWAVDPIADQALVNAIAPETAEPCRVCWQL
jgi:non-heme chloroperoxidase